MKKVGDVFTECLSHFTGIGSVVLIGFFGQLLRCVVLAVVLDDDELTCVRLRVLEVVS